MRSTTYLLVSIALTFELAAAAEGDGQVTKTDVFVSGAGGYHTYRIPAAIVTPKGTLLAFCEGRKTGRGDHGDLDLVLRRSSDQGATWSETQVVYEEGGDAKVTIGNPCPVVDRSTGRIWLPFCRDNDDVLVTHSDDDGVTWAKPADITQQTKLSDWGWYATGPGVGIQLERGRHKGRLVIPCDHRIQTDTKRVTYSHAIYSDDHGKTWKLGGTVDKHTNECQVVELDDGSLLMNMRNYWGRDGGQASRDKMRAVAVSDDGGASWRDLRFDTALIEPICQASLIRYDADDTSSQRLLFSNPASQTTRHRLTVRLSSDGGETWPSQLLLHAGPAAYSCLTTLPDGSLGCLYEAGEQNAYEKIVFAHFPLAAMVSAVAAADSPVVKELTGFKPPRAGRLPGFRRTKPLEIKAQEQLAKAFGEAEAAKLADKIDFAKQQLVFFQWAGSGQDKLTAAAEQQDGKPVVVFTFKPGRTRDLRPHAHLFAIRKGVAWKIGE